MRNALRAGALLFFVALAPSAALAASAPVCSPSAGKGGILTGLADQFSTTTAPWMTTALGYAQALFFALVAIEIAWSAITYVLQKDSLPDFVAALLLKILAVGFFYILLQPQYGPVWISDIVASFSQAGSAIGGESQFGPSDPSSVFNCGTDVANAMLQSISQNNVGINPGNILPAIEACFTALVCALGMVLAFAIIAGQLLITLIESYIVIGAGVFMLGFTGSRWTLVFGEKYVGYAVSVGIKLFMLELIVGLGYALGRQWAALFSNGIAPPETYIEVIGAALIFGFVAWQVPGLAGSLMNGAPRMSLGSFLETAGSVAVGGVVLGSGVGGMLAGGRAVSGGSAETLREARYRRLSDPVSLSTSATLGGNGRTHGDVADSYSREPRSGSEADTFAPQASAATAVDASDTPDKPPPTDPPEGGSPVGSSPQPTGAGGDGSSMDSSRTNEDAITGEEVAQTRASDAMLTADNEDMGRRAEQHDVQGTASGSNIPNSPINPALLRQPPVPDDSDDSNIHIRFKHPE
jgi:type IV secretion system protein TrbL